MNVARYIIIPYYNLLHLGNPNSKMIYCIFLAYLFLFLIFLGLNITRSYFVDSVNRTGNTSLLIARSSIRITPLTFETFET